MLDGNEDPVLLVTWEVLHSGDKEAGKHRALFPLTKPTQKVVETTLGSRFMLDVGKTIARVVKRDSK